MLKQGSLKKIIWGKAMRYPYKRQVNYNFLVREFAFAPLGARGICWFEKNINKSAHVMCNFSTEKNHRAMFIRCFIEIGLLTCN